MSSYNTSRTPCRYFQQGRCNKGNSCKFAHVYANDSGGLGQGTGQSMSEAELLKSFINPSSLPKIDRTINNDMKDAESFQMQPVTSAYSYGAPCAVNLISGRDYSPEESRLDYYNAQGQGTLPQYMTQIGARESDMQECINFTKSHKDWAARYLQVNTKQLTETGRRSMENEFINFPLDLTGSRNKSSGSAFGANPFTSAPSLSGASTVGAPASGTFGQPAFGSNNSTNSGSAFGAPSFGSSAFGNVGGTNTNNTTPKSGGIFGQPNFGGGTNNNSGSAFGAPSFGSNPFTSNTGGGAFGKPAFESTPGSGGSAFGKPAFGPATKPPTGGGASAFGKPAFGSNAFGSSAFGQSSFGSNTQQQQQPSSTGSAFGQPAFGTNPVGNAPASSGSAFGKPSFGAAPAQTSGTGTASAFGQPSFKSSPFGSTDSNVTQNPSPFGKSSFMQNKPSFTNTSNMNNSPFGSAPSSSGSPFASLQQNQNQTQAETQTQTSPFGQPTFRSQTQPSSTPFGSLNQPSATPFGSTTGPNAPSFSNIASSSASRPTPSSFVQGLPVEEDNIPAKDLDQKTLQQFQLDHFDLGEVPDIPPPLELIA